MTQAQAMRGVGSIDQIATRGPLPSSLALWMSTLLSSRKRQIRRMTGTLEIQPTSLVLALARYLIFGHP